MAPRGPAKARDYDYSNVGKSGRRTGITLREGKRDEHGMEEIEGMFSSPEKSPVRNNGFSNANETIIGSEGMSMDDGSAPGPADLLAGTNGRGSYFPPPVARSPMKTGLTGSPRRTPALRSSPIQRSDQASSSPSSGRQLNNKTSDAGNGPSQHVRSPLSQRRVNAPLASRTNGLRSKGKEKGEVFEPDTTADFSDGDGNGLLNGDENTGDYDLMEVQDIINSFNADEDVNQSGDEQAVEVDGVSEPGGSDQGISEAESPSVLASGSRKAKQKTADSGGQKHAHSAGERGQRIWKRNAIDVEVPPQKRKRPGRPPKVQRDGQEEAVDQRPAKKAKTTGQKPRDPNLTANPELDKVVEDYANRAGPLKGRSLYILKREAPSDQTTTHTRSGRVSVRPLAYWRNERCIYGDGEAEVGQRFPLTTIKEVIRTEELEPEKRRAGKRKSSKKSRSRKEKDDESGDDGEENADPWEKEGGVLHGYVRKWDAEVQTGTDEEEVLDIAYAPTGIETRDVKDSTFRFAKLLSSPFLGSGIVELPPSGVKKPKNSKKMHMVFYVCHGRVQVDISGVQFSAGKGCVFQVPRGNYYSFANTYEKDARLFFTQGCIPTELEATSATANSKAAAQQRETTTEAGRATGGTKGRPKGKQKIGTDAKE